MLAFFGARGQIAVGVSMFVLAVAQTVYWKWVHPPPTTDAVFIVSMEALAYGAYGVVATGIALLATERVEQHVSPDD